jgi:hypothetical protein
LNENLTSAIITYLKHFNKKIKKHKLNISLNKKALVLHSEEYIEKVKIIESICNDLDYKILKLDEFESQKSAKLNKIAEATQSQRLSCLPDTMSEKLKILDAIINNNQLKFNSLLNDIVMV